MVALLEVLEHELPVRLHGVGTLRRDLRPTQIERREQRVEFGPYGVEGGESLRKAHEHHAVELLERERVKAVGRDIEVGGHAARPGERAIEFVGPTMVGAHESLRLSKRLGTDT